jgi:hypothetical protein
LNKWARSQERPDTSARVARVAIVVWTRVHEIVSLELAGVFDDRSIDAQRLIDLEIDDAVRALSKPA